MMAFTEAAFLGRQDAIINSIALMDKFGHRVLGEKKSLEEVLTTMKNFTKMLKIDQTSEIQKLKDSMFGDIYRLIEGQPAPLRNSTSSLNHVLAANLMRYGAKMDLTVAYLRLGDYYYYGKHPEGVDYKKAFGYYRSATWYNNSVDF